MPDEKEVCCVLGICCRRGSTTQAKKLAKMMGRREMSGPYVPAGTVLSVYQLIPLDLLEERPEFAASLDQELRGYLERRGIPIEDEAGSGSEE